MKAFAHDYNLISIKSLISACFIHLLILELFVFHIPTLPEPKKPHLIFLGSIYKSQDIAVISPHQATSKKETLKQDRKILGNSDENFLNHLKSHKPANTLIDKQTKSTQKTTFLHSKQNIAKDQNKEEELKITVEQESYRPLELDIE